MRMLLLPRPSAAAAAAHLLPVARAAATEAVHGGLRAGDAERHVAQRGGQQQQRGWDQADDPRQHERLVL
eukprot:3287837-Prymnesium_polylepis.1